MDVLVEPETVARRRRRRWPLRLLATLLATVGLLGFLAFLSGAFWTVYGPAHPKFLSDVEFPLGHLEDAVSDRQGRIYVGLGFYSRVQVYNSEGGFLHGFFVDTHGGAFRLRMDQQNHLNVATARGDMHHIFDTSGKLLQTQSNIKGIYEAFSRNGVPSVDAHGRAYVIRDALFNPEVLRLEPSGRTSLTVRSPLVLRPLTGPLLCWLLALGAGISAYLLGAWLRVFGGRTHTSDAARRRSIPAQEIVLHYRDGRTTFYDVVLTANEICWAKHVWPFRERYRCIALTDLTVRIARVGLLGWIHCLDLRSVRDPELHHRFCPRNPLPWIRCLQQSEVEIEDPHMALRYRWLLPLLNSLDIGAFVAAVLACLFALHAINRTGWYVGAAGLLLWFAANTLSNRARRSEAPRE